MSLQRRRRLAAILLLTALAAPPALADLPTFEKVADVFTPIPGRPGETFADAGGDD